jgi:hypothetical protein
MPAHPAKGNAEDAAKVQCCAHALGAEFEPHPVRDVEIFGPEPRGKRTRIEEDGVSGKTLRR